MKKIIPAKAILIPDNAKRVFKGVIFDVYQWPQTEFDGSVKTYEMVRRPDTVVIIGVVGGKLLIIDEQQPHVDRYLTFPTGKIDSAGDSPLIAAQREMKEETGYEFAKWRLINVMQPHLKLEWFVHVFVASEGRQSTAAPEAGEKIKVVPLPFDEVRRLSFARKGYLAKSEDIFRAADKVEDLLNLPEFEGLEVDR